MRIHLIAMGGAVMHNLALALQKNGHFVTGSDDEIYNPAKDRLEKAGLLPEKFGWFPDNITLDLDFVILGMHARAENPELQKALKIGVKVYSFPEFIFQHSKKKQRVVVAGSHGKMTTTSMIMHVLRKAGLDFDYLVGAQLDSFETMVQLSDAPIMVIEGDEYLSSTIDRRPKFLHYRTPDVACVFYTPHTLEMKKMPPIEPEEIKVAFQMPRLIVFTEREKLQNFLMSQNLENSNLFLMSSGNFGGMDIPAFAQSLAEHN